MESSINQQADSKSVEVVSDVTPVRNEQLNVATTQTNQGLASGARRVPNQDSFHVKPGSPSTIRKGPDPHYNYHQTTPQMHQPFASYPNDSQSSEMHYSQMKHHAFLCVLLIHPRIQNMGLPNILYHLRLSSHQKDYQ